MVMAWCGYSRKGRPCRASSGGGAAGWSVCTSLPSIPWRRRSSKALRPFSRGVYGWVFCAKNWQLLSQRFRIIPFIRRDPFETFAGATSLARVHLDRIEQRHPLRTLIPIGRRDAVRQGHAVPRGEAVDEDPLAFPPVGDALAAPLSRGKKRRQWRHTPTESCPVPRQSPECELASRPACHWPATAATSGAWHSSTPIA